MLRVRYFNEHQEICTHPLIAPSSCLVFGEDRVVELVERGKLLLVHQVELGI